MLKQLLHRIVAIPQVYDTAQRIVGASAMYAYGQAFVRQLGTPAKVLDLGGGTGIYRAVWPAASHYICLDTDIQKLDGFLSKHHENSTPLMGDVTQIPIADNSIDVAFCSAVSHHLDDALFERFIDESHRVLKPGGKLVFMDAIWAPRRLTGRLLWSLDRGSYPRREDVIRAFIARRFEITRWESNAIHHRYVWVVATKTA